MGRLALNRWVSSFARVRSSASSGSLASYSSPASMRCLLVGGLFIRRWCEVAMGVSCEAGKNSRGPVGFRELC